MKKMIKNEKIVDAKIENIISNKKIGTGFIIVSISILTIILIVSLFFIYKERGNLISKQTNKFKNEYENLNDKKNPKNDKTYVSLKIGLDTEIKYTSYDEIFDMLDNKKTGIIFFGFPECPWCRILVPIFLESAKEAGLDKVYYFNNRNDRDIKKIEDGKIKEEKAGSENYYKLVDRLKDFLGEYEELNDKNIKRLYYPTVIFIKDGLVIDTHIGTIDEQEDPYQKLSKSEEKTLKEELKRKINKVITCKDAC